MTVFSLSNQFFNVAAAVYALAFFLYAGQLVSTRKVFTRASSWAARGAWAFHTAALILRWIHAGVGHPPWTNLYESLVFFSWGVMGVHLLLEYRFGFKLSGVFASAVVFVAMGIATLHPQKEIEPLVPALQSWWLLFHVFMACIAYAFFLSASFFSVFYLLRDRVKVETMAGVAALVCILFLAIAAGKSFFTEGQIQFFKVMQMEGRDVIVNFKGADGKLVQQFVNLPGAAYLLWPALGLYAVSAGLLLRGARAGRWVLGGALLAHTALLLDIVVAPRFVGEMALKSNPYRLAGVIMTLGIATFCVILFKFKDRMLKLLPAGEVLDRWNYQAVLAGVPFMTLNLVSGAVWAYYAWGRYWGWDPKETWALVTFLIYVLYLHMRLLAGWKGRKTALISIGGFFVVIFTYLGVNLVISGLHSYATG